MIFRKKRGWEAFKLNVFTSSRERGENERLGVKERERGDDWVSKVPDET